MDSLTHRPLLVLTGPQFGHYEDESSLCLWGWTVSGLNVQSVRAFPLLCAQGAQQKVES